MIDSESSTGAWLTWLPLPSFRRVAAENSGTMSGTAYGHSSRTSRADRGGKGRHDVRPARSSRPGRGRPWRAQELREFAIQCIVSSVPWPVAQRRRPAYSTRRPLAGLPALGQPPRRQSRGHRDRAAGTARPELAATRPCRGGPPDLLFSRPEAEAELIALARREWPVGAESYHRQVFYGLGGLGGRAAVDALIDELLATRLEPTIQSGILDALRMPSLGAIDPDGRDRVLRHVATTDPQDPRLGVWLGALEGLPIREGGEILLQIMRRPHALPEVRRLAAGLLVGCSDQAVLHKAVQGYAQEADHEVRLELLRAARNWNLGIQRDAIRSCVLNEQAISDEREVALAVLLSLDQRDPDPMTGELLAALLPASLADPAFPLGDTVLDAAEQLPARCLPVLAAHIRQFAEAPLAAAWGTNPKAANALACRDPTTAVDLLLCARRRLARRLRDRQPRSARRVEFLGNIAGGSACKHSAALPSVVPARLRSNPSRAARMGPRNRAFGL